MPTKTEYLVKTFNELLSFEGDLHIDDIAPNLMELKIKINGDQFDSSITGEVAKAIGSLQSALYRAAAEILHGSPNINVLTAEEKEQFEIVVRIQPGCSLLTIPGEKYLSNLATKAIDKMESKHITLVLCCLICAFAARDFGVAYITAAAKNSEHNAMVEQARVLAAPLSNAIQAGGKEIAKSAKHADSVEVGERKFDRQEIENLNKRQAKQAAQVDTYQTECKINGIRKEGNNLKVDMFDTNMGESFSVLILPLPIFDQDMPVKPTALAPFIESGQRVFVTLLIRETKTKTERILIGFAPVQDDEKPLDDSDLK